MEKGQVEGTHHKHVQVGLPFGGHLIRCSVKPIDVALTLKQVSPELKHKSYMDQFPLGSNLGRFGPIFRPT